MGWITQPTAGHERHGQSVISDETSGQSIAIVYDGKAHGPLLSAAPDMLRGCHWAHGILSQLVPPWGSDAKRDFLDGLAALEAAIAKATKTE